MKNAIARLIAWWSRPNPVIPQPEGGIFPSGFTISGLQGQDPPEAQEVPVHDAGGNYVGSVIATTKGPKIPEPSTQAGEGHADDLDTGNAGDC